MRSLTVTLALGVTLAGCAAPKVQLSSLGPGPEKASTFRFAAPAPATAPIQPQVEARLAALGYRRADADARYVVEVAATARPLHVGAYVENPDPWLDPPKTRAPKTLSLCKVGVRFVDARSGAETYRVTAQQRRLKTGCLVQDAHLAELALTDLPLPPPPPKPARSGG